MYGSQDDSLLNEGKTSSPSNIGMEFGNFSYKNVSSLGDITLANDVNLEKNGE